MINGSRDEGRSKYHDYRLVDIVNNFSVSIFEHRDVYMYIQWLSVSRLSIIHLEVIASAGTLDAP